MFDFITKHKKIFFSGVCGISMYSLAIAAKRAGFDVVGSDSAPNSEIRETLEKSGIRVIPFHSAESVDCDVFVHTSAVLEANPELKKARNIGARIYTRAELLGAVTDEFSERIGVAGTHGKSTVCGMCDAIMTACGCNHSAFIGAKGENGESFRLGGGSSVLFEACEYKRSFLNFNPTVGVILNLERDHTDCYPTYESQLSAFSDYAERSKTAVLSLDDRACHLIKHPSPFYFSLQNEAADLYADGLYSHYGCLSYIGILHGKREFKVKLNVPGVHNVRNSLAAMSVAHLMGLDLEKAANAISGFRGMKRRFEYIGTLNGAKVYDDYAHHPTEIRATLRAAREMGFREIYCAFQSHTFSRTASLFDEFSTAFSDADRVFITDIYAARERDDLGVSGKMLADATRNAEYVPITELAERLMAVARPDALIITMGAGELDKISKTVVTR